jgi:hypothetical protein
MSPAAEQSVIDLLRDIADELSAIRRLLEEQAESDPMRVLDRALKFGAERRADEEGV